MALMKASEAKRPNAESGAQRVQRKPEKTKDARYVSKVKVESKNANREMGVPRGARLTLWRAGAQPFDPAPRDLRMNRAAARFTSSASTEAARAGRRGSEYFFWAEEGAYGA